MWPKMEWNFWLLASLIGVAGVAAYCKDPVLPGRALMISGKLLGTVWSELAMGFLLAGLVEVLVPGKVLMSWLGSDGLMKSTVIGWLLGLAIPGGPYLVFPLVAGLWQQGAAPAALIALLTAKTLVSPVRMLTYEAPLLGWPLALARFLPGLLMPPVLGLIGQWLYMIFKARH